MGTWWNKLFSTRNYKDEPDWEEPSQNVEESTTLSNPVVNDDGEGKDKGKKYDITYGNPSGFTVSRIPELDEVIKPERGDPSLSISNLESTVPGQMPYPAYYRPVKETPMITGYTSGKSGVNIPIFDAPGNIFPMGLWDERRRSLLNAYRQRQAENTNDYFSAPQVHAPVQTSINEAWIGDMQSLINRATNEGKKNDLRRPYTKYGQEYLNMQNQYKTLAMTINRAADYASVILDPKNTDKFNPWQRKLANYITSGDYSNIEEYVSASKALYQIPDYNKRVMDEASQLIKSMDVRPITDDDIKKLTLLTGKTEEELIELKNLEGGHKLLSAIIAHSGVDEGRYENVAERITRDYEDMYRATYGDVTTEQMMQKAKDDIKSYIGEKYEIETRLASDPTRVNVNIGNGNERGDESIVGSYVNAYKTNESGFQQLLNNAANAMSEGGLNSARMVFKGMDSFVDKKGRKMFNYIPNYTDNENSVIKWKAVGETPPLIGKTLTLSLKQVHDDFKHNYNEKKAREIRKLIDKYGENYEVKFNITGINGVFLEPFRNKPITYNSLLNVSQSSSKWTGGTGQPSKNLSIIQPGWEFQLSQVKKDDGLNLDKREDEKGKIINDPIDYNIYENLEYMPGRTASQYDVSPGQTSFEKLNK
jgi:hypothetical protein